MLEIAVRDKNLAFLHRDDPELIFLVDPDKESLSSVVENTSALRPVPLHASGDQVFVAGDEKEMVIDKLLSVGFSHTQKRVVFASEVAGKLGEGGLHEVLNTQPLGLGDTG